MNETFDIGDEVKMEVVFTNDSNVAADPTTVTLKVKNPAGTVTTYTYAGGTVTKDGTGAYHKDFTIPSSGDSVGGWEYRYEGTGAVTAAVENVFDVRESSFY